MAAQIEKELGVKSELVVGDPGEFTVWVDGKKVAEKARWQFPEPRDVVAAVRAEQPH